MQVALCGGAAGWITSRPLAIMYCILLTPMWILLGTMAVYSSSILVASDKGLKGFCPEGNAYNGTWPEDDYHTLFAPYVDNIDGTLIPVVNKWMCSSQCPCSSNFTSVWQAGINEAAANKVGRTWNGASGMTPFLFQDDNGADYITNDFFGCFLDWKANWVSQTNGTIG